MNSRELEARFVHAGHIQGKKTLLVKIAIILSYAIPRTYQQTAYTIYHTNHANKRLGKITLGNKRIFFEIRALTSIKQERSYILRVTRTNLVIKPVA
jgi:hypothetical protein